MTDLLRGDRVRVITDTYPGYRSKVGTVADVDEPNDEIVVTFGLDLWPHKVFKVNEIARVKGMS